MRLIWDKSKTNSPNLICQVTHWIKGVLWPSNYWQQRLIWIWFGTILNNSRLEFWNHYDWMCWTSFVQSLEWCFVQFPVWTIWTTSCVALLVFSLLPLLWGVTYGCLVPSGTNLLDLQATLKGIIIPLVFFFSLQWIVPSDHKCFTSAHEGDTDEIGDGIFPSVIWIFLCNTLFGIN